MPNSDQNRASEIRRIYGLSEGDPQQVTPGFLPFRGWQAEGESFDPGIALRLQNLMRATYRAGVAEMEALQEAGIRMVKREGREGYKIDDNTPLMSNPLRPVQDGMRASEIRRIYGLLEEHPQQVMRGALPPDKWQAEGESFDPGIPRRLHHLLGNGVKAGEEEMEALQEAGIRMVKREGREGYKIDKNTPLMSNPLRPVQDDMRASEIRRIYGLLDGHPAQVKRGFLPGQAWQAEGRASIPVSRGVCTTSREKESGRVRRR
ncbi:hypothetical protein ACWGQ6_05850 [Streptomyces niveus]